MLFLCIIKIINYTCNKLNKFLNNRKTKCIHCNENINVIKMPFTTVLICDVNDNIIDENPKIWFIPKFKFNDVFLPLCCSPLVPAI
jgi:hypothetical protein